MNKNITSYIAPQAATYLICCINVAIFAFRLGDPQGLQIHAGALYHDSLTSHEYWRLVTHAFLHGGPAHLLMNMLCLIMWGGIVEQRVGATYFLIIYLAGAVGGGVASVYGIHEEFSTVGASGAISGVVGAMLCLAILGKLALSMQFFMVTIGVNVLMAANLPGVNWVAHLGGFTAGIAACAALDTAEMANKSWLRCKFPEFVKVSIALFLLCGYVFLLSAPLALKADWAAGRDEWIWLAGVAVLALLLIKGADFLLSRTRGLAAVAFGAAFLLGSLPLLLGPRLQGALRLGCEKARALETLGGTGLGRSVAHFACGPASAIELALAGVVFCGALFLLRGQMRRGWNDVGFVAEGFRAERRRRQGL